FFFFFLTWLGVSELEKDLVNISVAIETLVSNIADAIVTFQKKVSQLSEISLKNRMSPDTFLASQGGVCTNINTSYCMFVDQSGRISAAVW
ncbi:ERVV2 protein, partial [Acrocephalus arundinaceus]|nr:ERVV2 protein [Acrocephalus arundinaceus]